MEISICVLAFVFWRIFIPRCVLLERQEELHLLIVFSYLLRKRIEREEVKEPEVTSSEDESGDKSPLMELMSPTKERTEILGPSIGGSSHLTTSGPSCGIAASSDIATSCPNSSCIDDIPPTADTAPAISLDIPTDEVVGPTQLCSTPAQPFYSTLPTTEFSFFAPVTLGHIPRMQLLDALNWCQVGFCLKMDG